MIGALGGVTVVSAILCRDELRGGVILFWLLFAAAGLFHAGVVP